MHGPGQEPWEVYVVKGDSQTYGADPELSAATCCVDDNDKAEATVGTGTSGCC